MFSEIFPSNLCSFVQGKLSEFQESTIKMGCYENTIQTSTISVKLSMQILGWHI